MEAVALPPSAPPAASSKLIGFAYALIIFLCAILPGGLPLFMQTRAQSHAADKGLVLGTIFGGGVFIAAGFIHLLGDASGELNEDGGYPLAELWCAIGVLIPLCIDNVASLFAARASQAQQREDGRPSAAAQPELDPMARSNRPSADSFIQSMVLFDPTSREAPVTVIEDSAPRAAGVVANGSTEAGSIRVHDHSHTEHGHAEEHAHGHGGHGDDCCEHAHAEVHEHGHAEHSHGHGGGEASSQGDHAHAQHTHMPQVVQSRSVTVSIVGTLVLFLALTLHSFLAGLVLGLGGSVTGAGLFFAIIAHKSFAAWALGCALARTDRAELSFRAAVVSLVSFSLTTPSGVLIGMAISSAAALDGKVEATLVALASGFFLYVGLMEVVGKELVGYRTKGSGAFAILKLSMLILGFGLMAVLGLWV